MSWRRMLLAPVLLSLANLDAPAEELPLASANPRAHAGAVVAIAYTPDQTTLVTAGSDQRVKIWNVATGQVRADLGGFGASLAIAVSPDGQTLATGGDDSKIRLCKLSDGEAIATLSGHGSAVNSLMFSPDGTSLASASTDTTVRLWDLKTRAARKLEGHTAGVQGVAFSPDGSKLESVSRDSTVRLWSVTTGEELQTLGSHDNVARCVLFSRDGRFVISGGDDKKVRFWDISPDGRTRPTLGQVLKQTNGDSRPLPTFLEFDLEVRALALSPDGRILGVVPSGSDPLGRSPGVVALITADDRGNHEILKGHLGPVHALAFAPRGEVLATGGGDRSVRFWSVPTQSQQSAWVGVQPAVPVSERVMFQLEPVNALAFAPDGKHIATAGGSSVVTIWNAATREVDRRFRDPSGEVRAVAFSPDGSRIATGGDGQVVTLWNTASLAEVAKLAGHSGAITALAFAPDGKTLASASQDASVTIWDLERSAEIATLARHTSAVNCLAFSPDGRSLATGSQDWTVKIWDISARSVRFSLENHHGAIAAVAWSPDSKTVASASADSAARLWNAATGSELRTLRGHTGSVGAVAFTADGRSVFTGEENGTLRRYGTAGGLLVALQARAHQGAITAMAFAADGKSLATVGADRELRIWDAATQFGPRPFASIEEKVAHLALSGGGETLVSSTVAGVVQIWDTKTGRERTEPLKLTSTDVRIAVSTDGTLLATLPVGSTSAELSLWRTKDAKPADLLAVEPTEIKAVLFAPDNRSLFTAGKAVNISGLSGDPPLRVLKGTPGMARTLAVSPDGRYLAVGNLGGAVALWNLAADGPMTMLPGHARAVSPLAFSPDSKILASAGSHQAVQAILLWDLEKKSDVAVLPHPSGPITAICFDPGGRRIAAGSQADPRVTFWDLRTGRLEATLLISGATTNEGVTALVFAPDRKRLYAGCGRKISVCDVSAESPELLRANESFLRDDRGGAADARQPASTKVAP